MHLLGIQFAAPLQALQNQFRMSRDDPQRIIDFMCNTRRQIANAGEAFGADEFAALLRNFLLKRTNQLIEFARHRSEALSQRIEFVEFFRFHV